VLEPLHADGLVFVVVGDLVQAGHKNLHAGLRSHAGIAVHKLQVIAPLRDTRHVFLSIAVYLFDIRVDNANAGELSTEVWWRNCLLRVQEDVVAGDLDAGDIAGMEEVGNSDMEATKKTLEWNF
jgi:hypothetical protein